MDSNLGLAYCGKSLSLFPRWAPVSELHCGQCRCYTWKGKCSTRHVASIYKCSSGYYKAEVPHFAKPLLMPEGARVALGVGDVGYDHVRIRSSVSGHFVHAPAWASMCKGVHVGSQGGVGVHPCALGVYACASVCVSMRVSVGL